MNLMAFPDAQNAIVAREKVCEYLLNLSHPVGGPKAAWFATLGYSLENSEQLQFDLLAIAGNCENFVSKPSPYGVKYETTGLIGCEGHRPGIVVVVWIVEENLPPRLVTAYPGTK